MSARAAVCAAVSRSNTSCRTALTWAGADRWSSCRPSALSVAWTARLSVSHSSRVMRPSCSKRRTAWDSLLKALNTALREHPFHTVRAGELQRWEQSGAYATMVAGEYIRRGSEAERPLLDDVRDATDYYADQAKAAAQTVGDAIGRAADAFRDAFRTASGGVGEG